MSRLDEIEARVASATSGPWRADSSQPDDVLVWTGPRGEDAVILVQLGESAPVILGEVNPEHAPTGEFIARAREDVPWLLDRLRECERALEAVKDDEYGDSEHYCGHAAHCANKSHRSTMVEGCTCHVALVVAALEAIGK